MVLKGVQDEANGRVLREFYVGQRWKVELLGAIPIHEQQRPQVTLSPTTEGLEGVEDSEARAWYFVAPTELLGNWMDAYGGLLATQLMHRNFLSGGGAPDFIADAADIIIRSSTHELSYSHSIKALTYDSSVRVRLHTDDGWHVRALGGGTGGDVREVLKDVKALLIRGGFYRGSEITILHSFEISSSSSSASSSSASASASSAAGAAAADGGLSSAGGGGRDKGKWIPAKDPVSGRTYYWHSITKQSRWRMPKEEADAHSQNSSSSTFSTSSSASSVSSSSSRPCAQTVSQLLDARVHRESSDEGRRGEKAPSQGETRDFNERTEANVRGEGRAASGEDDGGVGAGGMSESERGSLLQRAGGQEMVQARVTLEDSILAITRTHLLVVDRHCVLRADVRNVESLQLSRESEGGAGKIFSSCVYRARARFF
jgi:hypothetical protein